MCTELHKCKTFSPTFFSLKHKWMFCELLRKPWKKRGLRTFFCFTTNGCTVIYSLEILFGKLFGNSNTWKVINLFLNRNHKYSDLFTDQSKFNKVFNVSIQFSNGIYNFRSLCKRSAYMWWWSKGLSFLKLNYLLQSTKHL